MKNQKVKTKNFILYLLFTICYLLFAVSAMAQYKLETGLPPIAGQPSPSEGLPQYINYLFVFGLGVIAILALAQMMIGGLTYILAAGNVAKVEDAKETIKQALLGLGLLLVSYLLLRTINPDLVNLRAPNLTPTQFQGAICVEWSAEGLQACMDQGGTSWEDCQRVACIRFQGSESDKGVIGGGGESYQWAEIPTNQYCRNVLGEGWVGVDDNHCQSPAPQWTFTCCGYFPNQ